MSFLSLFCLLPRPSHVTYLLNGPYKNPEQYWSIAILEYLKYEMTSSFNLIIISAWQVSKYEVFFWSLFFRIRTEYRKIPRISPYSIPMRKNTDQKKLRIWTLFTQCISTMKFSHTVYPQSKYSRTKWWYFVWWYHKWTVENMKNLSRFNTDCLASLRTYIILDFVLASVVLAVYDLTVSLKSHTSIRYSVLQTFLSKAQIYKLVIGNCGSSIYY